MTISDETKESIWDFLIDYGWAILVVLAAIGVLALFGVFDIMLGRYNDDCLNSTGERICHDMNKTFVSVENLSPDFLAKCSSFDREHGDYIGRYYFTKNESLNCREVKQ